MYRKTNLRGNTFKLCMGGGGRGEEARAHVKQYICGALTSREKSFRDSHASWIRCIDGKRAGCTGSVPSTDSKSNSTSSESESEAQCDSDDDEFDFDSDTRHAATGSVSLT
jgi:hypothetical protein